MNRQKMIMMVGDFCRQDTVMQLGKYLITGSTAFLIEYLFYVLLLGVFGVHYILASALVYSVVFWFAFLLNRRWTFRSKGCFEKQLFKYSLLFLFNLVFSNVVLMYLFVDVLGISAYLSPILKMAVVVCWNFLIYKYLIYT